ncbi:hypothetical protein SAMN05421827_105115 [Pedobacter terrae]|uniref:Uncharacterized protein n=1 Tax=Pedobacter terrae TaxID=405671 RepID=A0A1G7T9I3_9SPHI|nr:hypothetical protein [Pedobacter terrae]SDG31742.1 hypothetical protein SAMN05421827_105115 [Pedobacter terrae]
MNAQKFITEANKQRVCQLLGWSLDDYTQYQENKGLEYLREVVCCDLWSVNNVAKAPLFWKWWVNHWNARDAEFVADASSWPLDWLRRKYNDLNAVDGFTFWPHKIIMEQSYAYMIGDVNKESVRV